MKNGTKVFWVSWTGKLRSGTYVCEFATSPLSMVIGSWDNKVHRIHKSRLAYKEEQAADPNKVLVG